MLTKIWKSKMSSVEATTATKGALRALIERETIRTRSRTVAYENVASMIGTSSSWIRKFLTGNEAVAEPRITLFQNIRACYGQLCYRVEQEQQNELIKLARLRREIDAVTAGVDRLVATSQGAQTSRETFEATDEAQR